MELSTILLTTLAAALGYMVLGWLLSLARGKACVVDSLWGPGFILTTWLAFILGQGAVPRGLLVATLVTVWGVRLSVHLTRRNWGRPEDHRYAAMRAKWGERFWWVSFFTVFLLQGFLCWLISLVSQLPALAATPAGLTWLDGLGVLVWLFGFTFEAVGDRQLARFKADPANKGTVMDSGLWGLTRHPNYFGESVQWWGVWLIALATPYWLPALVGPVLITVFLLKVSGVSMLEKDIEERRPKYAEYKKNVSAFLPRLPKGQSWSGYALRLAEERRIPDWLIRLGIRCRHQATLRQLETADAAKELANKMDLIEAMDAGPVALAPDRANLQHYEVPPELFTLMLGPRMKYSGCWWPESQPVQSKYLDKAEEDMLEMTATRAQVADGQRILELGCGWGSFSLWAAARYPTATILAVSNSEPQIAHITALAEERGLTNLTALRADMNEFQPPADAGPFDRVVSVEMFEHMRNWRELLARVGSWLADDGLVFLHHFSHVRHAYFYEEGPDDWMSQHFFAGGLMPSDDMALHFAEHFSVAGRWRVNGDHYARTLRAWLQNLDRNAVEARSVLAGSAPPDGPDVALQRWRMFLMACEELFAWNKGNEWLVTHCLLRKR